MYRASTPTHKLSIPWGESDISDLWLTYSQSDEIVLEKKYKNSDFTVEGNVWSVTLTQEETNLFKSDTAQAQIRVLFTDGTSIPSKVFQLPVFPVLNDEVMA